MQQILVEQRESLRAGQFVPVSDLFDALVAGDEPLTCEMGALWKSAQKVYGDLQREVLLKHAVGEDELATLPDTHAARRDDRIAKTLVLAALVPQVEPMRELTACKAVALNYGRIRSMLPNQEAGRSCAPSATGSRGSPPSRSPGTTRTRCWRCGSRAGVDGLGGAAADMHQGEVLRAGHAHAGQRAGGAAGGLVGVRQRGAGERLSRAAGELLLPPPRRPAADPGQESGGDAD
jgi:hypothetical protein